MDKKKLSHSSLQSSVTSVLAALLCILIGLIVGFLVLLAINPAHAWGDGFVRILKGGFHDAPYGVGKELANAAPLVMTGLSVAFAFKTGLFNIGAAGQYTLGAYGALYCAIMLKMPWFVCLLAATLLGGIWGAIPGFFKAYFNINEVITSIITVVLNLPRLAGAPVRQAHLITPQKRCYHCITSFSIRQAGNLRFFRFFVFSFSSPDCVTPLASRT